MHSEAPTQWALDQPRTNTGVVAAIDNAQDLTGIEVNDGCHLWGLEAVPGVGVWVFEVAYGTEAVLIDTEHPWAQGINIREREQAGFIHRSPNHPPRHGETGSGLGHGPA
ncbi:hypothetical protein [Arthrobacter psychrolactophilus]|uniref:hypothetical protein n=1 Tax=Arthrobacter psychrolactophilus TaxID=92442 RepID=UPI001FE47057|nr:hypothetical protein [Arthrobacter psychrolactophilus]